MRAVVRDRYGPPRVLQVAEIEAPSPGPDEVRIRVRAVEVTKADCELRAFRFPVRWFWLPLRIVMGIRRPRRHVLGCYFAGEIESCGEAVTRFTPGERVFGVTGLRMGAYAELLCIPASNAIAPMPESMTFTEGAALPLGGLNALHFMRLAHVRPGEHVLINGAGGSIGLHGLQIAKAMGAVVTVVDSGTKSQMLERFGADRVIDYTREAFTLLPETYDVIFDMVPSSSFRGCIGRLRPGGRYLSGNPRLSVMLRARLISWLTDKTATCAFAGETEDELRSLAAMADRGEIRSIVDRVVAPGEIASAHQLVETEARLGAIVMSFDPPA